MKRVVRAVLSTALVSAVLGAAAAPASAERWSGRDEAGDVTQYNFLVEPPPCGTLRETPRPDDTTTDLVGLRVRHEHGALALRARFRDLTAWGDRGISFQVETATRSFEVSVASWRRKSTPDVVLYEAGDPGPISECGSYSTINSGAPCDGIVTDRSSVRDTVDVVVPRTCLDSPRWVQVGASVQRQVGRRWLADAWGEPTPQGDTGYFEPALSPRIRHDR